MTKPSATSLEKSRRVRSLARQARINGGNALKAGRLREADAWSEVADFLDDLAERWQLGDVIAPRARLF